MRLNQLKKVVDKNIFNFPLVVYSVHLRTDKIEVLNHTFREPVSLEYARQVVRRLTKGQTIWNCKFYAPTQGYWGLD